jgi:hypothetical protein
MVLKYNSLKYLLKILYLPSIVKILLTAIAFLFISLALATCEIYHCKKLLNSKNRVFIDNSIFRNNENSKNTTAKAALMTGENNNFSIKNFTQVYLSKLFSKDINDKQEQSQWLKENTEETFFTQYLMQEIDTRSQNKIKSEFQINKIYLYSALSIEYSIFCIRIFYVLYSEYIIIIIYTLL